MSVVRKRPLHRTRPWKKVVTVVVAEDVTEDETELDGEVVTLVDCEEVAELVCEVVADVVAVVVRPQPQHACAWRPCPALLLKSACVCRAFAGSISLSTKMLEAKPGEVVRNKAAVFERAGRRARGEDEPADAAATTASARSDS